MESLPKGNVVCKSTLVWIGGTSYDYCMCFWPDGARDAYGQMGDGFWRSTSSA